MLITVRSFFPVSKSCTCLLRKIELLIITFNSNSLLTYKKEVSSGKWGEILNFKMNDKMKVMTKLYVSNLPANCTRRCLTDFFNQFGDVQECAIMWDTYAFVHYASMEEAQNALVQASHANLMGNKLSIKLSTSKNRQTTNWYQNKVIRLLNDTYLISLLLKHILKLEISF